MELSSKRALTSVISAAASYVTSKLHVPASYEVTWLLAVVALIAFAVLIFDLAREHLLQQQPSRPYIPSSINDIINKLSGKPHIEWIVTIAFALLVGAIWLSIVWNFISPDGEWRGSTFVFKEPQLVETITVGPQDNGRVIPLTVKDAGANSFVYFDIEYYGGLGVGVITVHENNVRGTLVPAHRGTRYGVHLTKERSTKLVVQIPPDSDQTIMRVYAVSWEKAK